MSWGCRVMDVFELVVAAVDEVDSARGGMFVRQSEKGPVREV